MKKLIASLIATIMVVLMVQVPCFAADKKNIGDRVSVTFSGLNARTIGIDISTSNMKLVSASSDQGSLRGSSYVSLSLTDGSVMSYVTLTFEITGSGTASYTAEAEYARGDDTKTSTKSGSFSVYTQAEIDAMNAEAARQAEADRQAREAAEAANRAQQQQEKKNNNNNNNNNDNQQQENLEEVPAEELPQEQPEVIAAPVEQKPKSDFKFRSIPIKLHEMLIKAMESKTEQLKKEQEARINAPEKTEEVKVAEVKEEKEETVNKVVGAVTPDNGGSNGGNFLANIKLGDMAIVAGAIIGGCLLIMTSHLGKSSRKEKQNHLRERV